MPDTPASWRERLAALLPLPTGVSLASPGPRAAAAAMAAAGVAVAVALAVVVLRGAPAPPELSLPRAGPPGADAGAGAGADGSRAEPDPEAYVHVAGAVARPGVYRVRPGGRVADVVDAAGGPGPEADVDQLNLAAKVSDGERVYVPRRGETPPAQLAGGTAAGGAGSGGAGDAGAGGDGSRVDLNTATLDQLEALPGVGPATAQAIFDYRREHGRFSQVQELLEVRGIGEAKLAALRSRVRV